MGTSQGGPTTTEQQCALDLLSLASEAIEKATRLLTSRPRRHIHIKITADTSQLEAALKRAKDAL